MSAPAIKVEGLWKEYTVGAARQQHGTFYDLLSHSLRSPLRRLRSLGGRAEDPQRFWALRDVNFEIQPGEVVGVIGRNGAGKSTLLKMLSRITAPTKGRIQVRGRLASLLEVGTGFHPELSGRENIYLNGAILGMTRSDIASKFDEIVAFAEVEKFIDTPVKRYSSGMYVRLAFAVAAHMEVDVLLVDEVLAVGDAAFQEKCLSKMSALQSVDRAVIFVSHDVGAVTRLCSRSIVLGGGMVEYDGPVTGALSHYYDRQLGSKIDLSSVRFDGTLVKEINLSGLTIEGRFVGDSGLLDPDAGITLTLHGQASRAFDDIDIVLAVFVRGTRLFTQHDTAERSPLNKGAFRSTFRLPPNLLRPGTYEVGIGLGRSAGREHSWNASVAQFRVAEIWAHHRRADAHGLISAPCGSTREYV